jgi:HlyD family secretion protein
MRRWPISRRRWAVAAVLAILTLAFVYVAVRSGPLAPVPVTVATVEEGVVAPARFGIGTIEARRAYRIGPTAAGRVARVLVDVGDHVAAGEVVAEIDPVDLDARLAAQRAALERTRASLASAEARRLDAEARQVYARAQERRGAALVGEGVVSRDAYESRQQERSVAEAAVTAAVAELEAARQEAKRAERELEALLAQRGNLRP